MTVSKKKRLDVLLVEKGLFPSREKARAAVMAGQVLVAGNKVEKPGTSVLEEADLRLLQEAVPFVSRGGLKLEKAVQSFGLDLQGKTVLDVGASTGGFTDCALKHGAAKVYAIDVGYGQLAWELRKDSRVVSLERTNIRYLTPEQLGDRADVATVDVSFISLTKVLPAVLGLVSEEGIIVALIKPQFEAGKELVEKKGVVRDPGVHREVLLRVLRFAGELGLVVTNLAYSPIRGPEGNIEYLAELQRNPVGQLTGELSEKVKILVEEAHMNLQN